MPWNYYNSCKILKFTPQITFKNYQNRNINRKKQKQEQEQKQKQKQKYR